MIAASEQSCIFKMESRMDFFVGCYLRSCVFKALCWFDEGGGYSQDLHAWLEFRLVIYYLFIVKLSLSLFLSLSIS